MQRFEVDGGVYAYPDVETVSVDPVTLRIVEGEYAGVVFSISDIQVLDEETDNGDAFLNYQLDVIDPEPRHNRDLSIISYYAESFMIKALLDQIDQTK